MNSIASLVATLHEALHADPIEDQGLWEENLPDSLVLVVNGRDEVQHYWRFNFDLAPFEIAVFDDETGHCVGFELDSAPFEFTTGDGERITLALGQAIAEAKRSGT